MDINIILWLVALIVFAVVEISTVLLVAVWFCFGSLGALIASLLRLEFVWQITIFLIISIILIIFTRPFVKKFLMPNIVKTNYDRIIGMECVVLEDIENMQNKGSVKVSGQVWTARSKDGSIIKAGEVVKIIEISGVKLIVENLKNKE